MSAGVSFEAVVTGRRDAADGVVVLDLERATGTLPHWSPGAHIDVVLPSGIERQYSLCGSPTARGTWRIGVLREREGSVWLHDNAHVGATLRVRGPANHFLFAPTAGRSYVFVAGGIGITPLVPMIEAADAAGAEWTLLYLGRSRTTMAFVDDLVARYGERVEVFAADEGRRLDLSARFATPVAAPSSTRAAPRAFSTGSRMPWPTGPAGASTSSGSRRRCSASRSGRSRSRST